MTKELFETANLTPNKQINETTNRITEMPKPFSELNLIDDFMFDVATVDLEVCKDIVELSLNIRIREIHWKENQKVIHNTPGKRGIRLDFYVVDDTGKTFDVEMQAEKRGNLPKRTRFYKALLDSPVLKSGEPAFDRLPPVYIIFICGFDLFRYGKYRYTFEYRCRENPDILLNDDSHIVFLNTEGTDSSDVEPQLIDFLRFVKNSSDAAAAGSSDARVRRLYDTIRILKSRTDLEASYMKMEERDRMIEERGEKRGEERGRKIGEEHGKIIGAQLGAQAKLKSLVQKKLSLGQSAAQIAEDLVEEPAVIQSIIEALNA